MSRTKIHHYNPQSVLRLFSVNDEGTQVWVFDKETATIRIESISTAGGEKYFNHVVINGKRVDFEGIFESVDGALPDLLSKIVTTESVAKLSTSDRDALCLLAVIQFLRVRIIRESAHAITGQLRTVLTEAGLPQLAEAIPIASENDGRRVALALLADAKNLAAHFRDKELTLYRAPDGSAFWTSDAPVVMVNHFPSGNLALGARGVEVIWPISSRFLLSFRCPSIGKKLEEKSPELAAFLATEPVLLCRPRDVDWFNALQMQRSTRFVYADANRLELARRTVDERELARPLLVSASPLGTMPDKPGMPRGISLIVSGRQTEHLCPVSGWQRAEGDIRLRIPEHAATVVANLLADSPFRSAEVYDPEGSGTGMRNVVIEQVSDHPIELLVSHGDPAWRTLNQHMDRHRRATRPPATDPLARPPT